MLWLKWESLVITVQLTQLKNESNRILLRKSFLRRLSANLTNPRTVYIWLKQAADLSFQNLIWTFSATPDHLKRYILIET